MTDPCRGKRRFPAERKAEAALSKIRRTKGNAQRVPVRAYECDHCKGWHLTSSAKAWD